VLRDGGYVCIRNGTRESDFPHRHFFVLRPVIDTELPARAGIAATLAWRAVSSTKCRREIVEKSALLQRLAFVMARGDVYLGVTYFPPFRCGWGFGLPAPALLSIDIDD
jgi:hypothetical protein